MSLFIIHLRIVLWLGPIPDGVIGFVNSLTPSIHLSINFLPLIQFRVVVGLEPIPDGVIGWVQLLNSVIKVQNNNNTINMVFFNRGN